MSFEVESLKQLAVHLAWAQVELFADDVERVQVLAAGDESSVRELKITTEDGTLLVEQPQYGLSLNIMESHWMQICIRVPQQWARPAELSTIGGMLSARGVQASQITMDTVSGELRAVRLAADEISLRSISGDIRAQEIKADTLILRTVSGDITLDHSQAGSLRGTTVSGEQTLQLTSVCSPIELRSVSGDVRLSMPADRMNASMRSVSGRINTENVVLSEDAGVPVVRVTGVSADLKLTAIKN